MTRSAMATAAAAAILGLLGGIGIGIDIGRAGRGQRRIDLAPTRVVQVEFTGCLVWLERADRAPAGPVVFHVPLEMARERKERKE